MNIKLNIDFLADLLIDPRMITEEPRTEVGKRALEIYHQFENDPSKITFGTLQDTVSSESTQIGNPGPYLAHIANTAGILRSLVIQLGRLHPTLTLPHPDRAYAMGLVHDLNATFSNYARGGQESKEFDEFILAKAHGWNRMEKEVALHSVYLETIKLMSQDAKFPKEEAFVNMKAVLKGDGPFSYKEIKKQFAGLLAGRDNLPLILLTLADYMAVDQPTFDVNRLDENFAARSEDIMFRYYGKAVADRRIPSLLGQALVSGGMDRIIGYKQLVENLFENHPEVISDLRNTTTFWQ